MSIIFFDGFDSYSTGSELVSANPSLSINVPNDHFSTSNGRFSGGRIHLATAGRYVYYSSLTGVSEFWQGFALKLPYIQNTGMFLTFSSPAGIEMSVGSDTNLNLNVYRGSRGTGNLVASNSYTFQGSWISSDINAATPWYWMDVRYKWGNNNNGNFEVWVNGVQKISLSSVNTVYNTAQTAITNTGFYHEISAVVPNIDDWCIINVDSTAPNTRIGDVRVGRILPNSDYITSGTATPGPTYYTGVDDGATANTSDYITLNNITGENVAFGVASLPSNASNIYGLSVITQQSKSDAGSANARHIVISNNIQGNGSVFTLSTTSNKTKTYFVTDPETSAAWTNTAVANVKIGFGVDA